MAQPSDVSQGGGRTYLQTSTPFLSADLPSATTVARTLFPGLEASVHRVETQVVSDVGIPDFCFELATGKRLYVEHKFDARLNETQLQRYVALGRVALISRTNQSILKDVLDSPNYSHPTDPLHVHDTRHTFASRLLQAGVDIYTVSKLLRHASVVMSERYAHLSQADLRAAVERHACQ